MQILCSHDTLKLLPADNLIAMEHQKFEFCHILKNAVIREIVYFVPTEIELPQGVANIGNKTEVTSDDVVPMQEQGRKLCAR